MIKLVAESIKFERGQDPKRAMGIGLSYDNLVPGMILRMRYDIPSIYQLEGDLYRVVLAEKLKGGVKNIKCVHISKDGRDLGHEYSWQMSKKFFNENIDIIGSANESINFERGQEPKTAMGIGVGHLLNQLDIRAKESGYEREPRAVDPDNGEIMVWTNSDHDYYTKFIVLQKRSDNNRDNIQHTKYPLYEIYYDYKIQAGTINVDHFLEPIHWG